MKEALEYKILVVNNNDDFYLTIKKYLKLTKPVSFKDNNNQIVNYIDNGSYLVEVTPKNDNYNVRFYITKDFKIIDLYVDISLKNGERNKVPYYIDLYLDIVNYPNENRLRFDDEDELLDALKQKKISKKDYEFAYAVGNKIIEEIRQSKNKIINMDIISLLKSNITL